MSRDQEGSTVLCRLRLDVEVGVGGLSWGCWCRDCWALAEAGARLPRLRAGGGGRGWSSLMSLLSSPLDAETISSKSELDSGSESESVGGPGMSAGIAGKSVLE